MVVGQVKSSEYQTQYLPSQSLVQTTCTISLPNIYYFNYLLNRALISVYFGKLMMLIAQDMLKINIYRVKISQETYVYIVNIVTFVS